MGLVHSPAAVWQLFSRFCTRDVQIGEDDENSVARGPWDFFVDMMINQWGVFSRTCKEFVAPESSWGIIRFPWHRISERFFINDQHDNSPLRRATFKNIFWWTCMLTSRPTGLEAADTVFPYISYNDIFLSHQHNRILIWGADSNNFILNDVTSAVGNLAIGRHK